MQVHKKLLFHFVLFSCDVTCYATSPGYSLIPLVAYADGIRWVHCGPFELMIEPARA